MLIDWIHWLSSLRVDELLWLLAPILLLDAPRYTIGALGVWAADALDELRAWWNGEQPSAEFTCCPSVCVVIAGYNEADGLDATLRSLWGTYPRLQIIIVDDGSADAMSAIAGEFAQRHAGVTVIRRPERGGKSSALNVALKFTQAEVIACVDGDSTLGPNAIWQIVQPFAEPTVGAVSGCVVGRRPFANLTTWLQSFEYLRCIFIGRMFTSRLGVLGIVSGAFGAFRRDAILRMHGWDVGPGEDGDITLRLRKAGYEIVYEHRAQCLTDLCGSFWQLVRQRRRWEWAVVTFECRKHIDLANVFHANFRISNLVMLADRWLFNIALQYCFWGYLAWVCFHPHEHTLKQFALYYVVYVILELFQIAVVLYYSSHRLRDAAIGLVTPLMPAYYLILRLVSLWAITEELLVRRSFRDNFVPQRVREATWHW